MQWFVEAWQTHSVFDRVDADRGVRIVMIRGLGALKRCFRAVAASVKCGFGRWLSGVLRFVYL
jgi:hypothetical protein